MGRVGNESNLIQQFGGLNESISTIQKDIVEFDDCLNVYLLKYGKYGAVAKRKGSTLLNSVAMDGQVKAIYPMFLQNTPYLYSFSSAGTFYGVNRTTGVLTSIKTGCSTTTLPTMATVNDTLFLNIDPDETSISTCEATTGWAATGTGTGTLATDSGNKIEALTSLKIPVVASGAGLNGAEFTAALNLTGKTVEYYASIAQRIATTNRARTANVATLTTGAAHGLNVGDYVSITSVGGTGYNTTYAVPVKEVPTTTTFTYACTGADEAGTADTAGLILTQKLPTTITKWRITLFTGANSTYWEGTKDFAGIELQAYPAWNKIQLPVDLTTKTGNSGSDCTLASIDKIRLEFNVSAATNYQINYDKVVYFTTAGGLYYSQDGSTFTQVSNVYKPRAKRICSYDSRLFAIDTSNVYWSNIGDGTDWYPYSSVFDRNADGTVDTDKSASSTPINKGDGDTLTGMRVLGTQLIIFKQHGIFRLSASGATSPIYRIVPQLSGQEGKGVGCSSHEAIQNAVLDNLYSDVYGKAEYLIFPSDKGIHALGITGNPLDIHDRVRRTFDCISSTWLPNSQACIDPRSGLYIMTVSDTRQLVFGLTAKGWTKYGFSSVRALASLVYGTDKYVLLGDLNGYMYKHNATDYEYYSDYIDNGSAYTASLTTKTSVLQNNSRGVQVEGLTVLTEDGGTRNYTVEMVQDSRLEDLVESQNRTIGGKPITDFGSAYYPTVAGDGFLYSVSSTTTAAWRFNAGSTWEQLGAVGAAARKVVYLKGSLYRRASGGGSTSIYKYNPATGVWDTYATAPYAFTNVSSDNLCTDGTYLWTIGYSGASPNKHIITSYYNGSAWVDVEDQTYTDPVILGIFAIGTDIYSLVSDTPYTTYKLRKNNTVHSDLPGTPGNIKSPGNVFAVLSGELYFGNGADIKVYKYSGGNWAPIYTHSTPVTTGGNLNLMVNGTTLYSLYTRDISGVIVPASDNSVVLWNGSTATTITANATLDYRNSIFMYAGYPTIFTNVTGALIQYIDGSWQNYLGSQYRETDFIAKGHASYASLKFTHSTGSQAWKLLGYYLNMKRSNNKKG